MRLAIRAARITREQQDRLEGDWRAWLTRMFPGRFAAFAPHHERFWRWVWAIELRERPRPFTGIWARKGGKSTSAEAAVGALGLRGRRRYAVYLRATQDQADNSVSNIAGLLERPEVATRYPGVAERAVGKYGASKGWRRNRLRTAGFTVDAMGLDTAVRGAKVDDERPDLIVLDDIDEKHDSPAATQKKSETIRHSILPIGTDATAVIAIQNLIIPDGVFAQLADGRADWLTDRIVDGPIPAVEDLEMESTFDENLGKNRYRVTGGRATWSGFDLRAAEREINTVGPAAFLEECQHEVDAVEGALWTKELLDRCRTTADSEVPDMLRVVIGVDPSGGGDAIGIVVVGLGADGRAYVLADRTQPGALGTANWATAVRDAYYEFEGDRVVAEGNFGGEMVESTIKVTDDGLPVTLVHASRGKRQRAEPVANAYEEGRVSHVGTFPELEREQRRWRPGEKWSPNRMDAVVWAITEALLDQPSYSFGVVGA